MWGGGQIKSHRSAPQASKVTEEDYGSLSGLKFTSVRSGWPRAAEKIGCGLISVLALPHPADTTGVHAAQALPASPLGHRARWAFGSLTVRSPSCRRELRRLHFDGDIFDTEAK